MTDKTVTIRWLSAVAVAVVVALPGSASTQTDDFTTCLKASGEVAAIACKRVTVQSSDAISRHPKDAEAYARRGDANVSLGDFDAAIGDYGQSINLDPVNATLYLARGRAYFRKLDLAHAITDYDKALALNPKYVAAYLSRGIAYLYDNLATKALSDFAAANVYDPSYPYPALWAEIVNKRLRRPSQLAQQAAKLNMARWPSELVKLYLGQIKPEAAFANARSADANTAVVQTCETNFFVGQMKLQAGDKAGSVAMFDRAAADYCPKSFSAWSGAKAELHALGEPSAKEAE